MSLAPFNPTSDDSLKIVLQFMQLSNDDIVVDLGCGDGRFLIQAAKTTPVKKAIGIEVDPTFYHRATAAVRTSNVQDRIDIVLGDALSFDWSLATHVFLYLVPNGIQLLLPKLKEARARGVCIVTNMFAIPNWNPTEMTLCRGTKVIIKLRRIKDGV